MILKTDIIVQKREQVTDDKDGSIRVVLVPHRLFVNVQETSSYNGDQLPYISAIWEKDEKP